ncbi:unnamed protein product, partial [Gadus morhua 'NCC']
ENGPVWLEEGGHFPFNSPKKTFGIAAGSKGLEKGPGGLLYVMGIYPHQVYGDDVGASVAMVNAWNPVVRGDVRPSGEDHDVCLGVPLKRCALMVSLTPEHRGGGVVSAGEEDDGQSRFRVAALARERRLGLGAEEAGMVTGGSRSGVGDPRLVSTTQGGSMTAEVVRTGAIVDCGRLGSGGKAPRSERSSGVAGGGGSGADSSSRSAEMEDGNKSQEELLTLLASEYDEWLDLYPCLSLLASIALIVPVSSVNCERDFSAMNRIKTDLRNRLQGEHLAAWLGISINGPEPKEVPYDLGLEFFFRNTRKFWKLNLTIC